MLGPIPYTTSTFSFSRNTGVDRVRPEGDDPVDKCADVLQHFYHYSSIDNISNFPIFKRTIKFLFYSVVMVLVGISAILPLPRIWLSSVFSLCPPSIFPSRLMRHHPRHGRNACNRSNRGRRCNNRPHPLQRYFRPHPGPPILPIHPVTSAFGPLSRAPVSPVFTNHNFPRS